MHMICPFMPIPASTQLTEFLDILCRKKNYRTLFQRPPLLAPGAHAPGPLPAATAQTSGVWTAATPTLTI